MHVITETKWYEVRSYDELDEEGKNKALTEALQWIMGVVPYEDMPPEGKKAVEKAEEMKTPWFTHEYLMEYVGGWVESFARDEEYRTEIKPVTKGGE